MTSTEDAFSSNSTVPLPSNEYNLITDIEAFIEENYHFNALSCNKYATRFMQRYVNSLDSDDSQRIIDHRTDLELETLADIAFGQMNFTMSFGFGIFMAVLLLLLGIIALLIRCFSQQQPPRYGLQGLLGIALAIIILLLSLVFAVLGATLLLSNSRSSKSAVCELKKLLDQDTLSLSTLLHLDARDTIRFLESTHFISDGTNRKEIAHFKEFMGNIVSEFGHLNGSYVFNLLVPLQLKAQNFRDTGYFERFPNLDTALNDFLNANKMTNLEAFAKMNSIMTEVGKLSTHFYILRRKVLEEYESLIKLCEEVLEKIVLRVKEVDEETKLYLSADGIVSKSNQALIGISLPIMIAGACLCGIVALSASLSVNYKTLIDGMPPTHGLLSNVLAEIIGASAYVTMGFGAILFTMFSVCFLFGFEVIAATEGLYEDPTVYEKANFTIMVKPRLDPLNIKITDVIMKCLKDEKLFAASQLNVILSNGTFSKVLNTTVQETIPKELAFTGLKVHVSYFEELSHSMINIVPSLDIAKTAELDEPEVQLIEQFRADISKISTESKETIGSINRLQDKQNIVIKLLETHLENYKKDIIHKYSSFMKTLEEQSPMCKRVAIHRAGLRNLLYNGVIIPLQGQWLACLIAAISSIFAFLGLLMSTKYLRSYESPSSEAEFLDEGKMQKTKLSIGKSKESKSIDDKVPGLAST